MIMVTGLPMPYRAVAVFADGSREEVEGIICVAGETFQEAVIRTASSAGAERVEFSDGWVVPLTKRARKQAEFEAWARVN